MKVLLGVSGVDPVEEVVAQAVARAREAADEVTVAILDEPDAEVAVTGVEQAVQDVLADLGFDAEVLVRDGHPGSELVELADGRGFDRLVISGGTRSPLGKIQLGSTAEFVLLNASTTVTLLR
ncbi:MAG: universal stress protein [Haloarculaceae archaeon]